MVSVRKRHKVWPITGVSPSLVVGAAVAHPYYYGAPPCGYYPYPPPCPAYQGHLASGKPPQPGGLLWPKCGRELVA
jgi:hypothetical protein